MRGEENAAGGPILTVSVSALRTSPGLSGRQLTTQLKSPRLCAATLGAVNSANSRHWSRSGSSARPRAVPGFP